MGAATGADSGPTDVHKIDFHIAQQSIGDALTEFGEQSGFAIGIPAALAHDVTVRPLDGQFTPDEALQQLLGPVGLRAVYVDKKTITVRIAQNELGRPTYSELTTEAKRRPDGTLTSTDSGPDHSSQSLNTSDVTETLQEVLVTGTHIKGVENKTVEKIVIDRGQIERSGYSTTQELFRSLPQNFGGGSTAASDDGRFVTGGNAGTNFTSTNAINLRGLGESSTLVLLNGHRIAPAVYGTAVDISTIPTAAIERIEILPDGSSALYGSDAVGGVVNIILRSDYEGAATTARYGSVTSGSRSETDAEQVAGGKWETGSLVGTLQYQDQGRLPAQDRYPISTSSLTFPNDLFPHTTAYGGSLDLRQRVTDGLSVYLDTLLSRRDTERNTSQLTPKLTLGDPHAKSESVNIAPGLQWTLGGGWSLDIAPAVSRQYSSQHSVSTPPPAGNGVITTDITYKEDSVDAVLSGTVLATHAGGLRSAVGVSYRHESLQENASTFGVPLVQNTRRHVSAAFGELYLPLVADADGIPLLRALDVHAAVRYDKYSDFGSVGNPQLGLRWSPAHGLDLRVNYGQSFRAPDALETILTASSIIAVYPFSNPAGGGVVPALAYFGSKPELKPERARTLNLGVEYAPLTVSGLKLSSDVYSVRYLNRIVSPAYAASALTDPAVYGSLITPLPSDAAALEFVDEARGSGAQYVDLLGKGVAGVRDVIDFRQQNAAAVHQNGADFAVTYTKLYSAGTLSAQGAAAYIQKIDTQLAPGSLTNDLVSTVGEPVKWRGRADLGWSSRGWTINGALNYTNEYVNTAAPGHPPIASWTTVDLYARLNLGAYFGGAMLSHTTLGGSVQNVFDRGAPYVNAPSLIRVLYDPANASPLGRFWTVELQVKW